MSQADPDARRRQAIQKISSAVMLLTHMTSDPEDQRWWVVQCREIREDLVRARHLLVHVEDPDGILDELASL